MASNDERYVPTVTAAIPKVEQSDIFRRPVPDLQSLNEIIRQIFMNIYKIEGRLGESVIRDDIRILGAISTEARATQPPISEVNEATIYLPNDGATGLLASQHGGPYLPLGGASPNIDITGTLGEDITAPALVYLSVGENGNTPGRWYYQHRDSNPGGVPLTPIMGFVRDNGLANAIVSIRVIGVVDELTGIVPGSQYTVSDTPGGIAEVTDYPIGAIVGTGETTTSIVLSQSWNNTLTTTSIDFAQDTLLSNVGAAETDFSGGSNPFPNYIADSLYPPGPIEHIDCNFSFRLAANANTKTIRVYSQGNVLMTFTTADPAITQVVGYAKFWPNVPSGTLRYNIVFIGGGAGANVIRIADSDVLVNNTDLDIQTTGQGTSNGDIIQSLHSSISYAYL